MSFKLPEPDWEKLKDICKQWQAKQEDVLKFAASGILQLHAFVTPYGNPIYYYSDGQSPGWRHCVWVATNPIIVTPENAALLIHHQFITLTEWRTKDDLLWRADLIRISNGLNISFSDLIIYQDEKKRFERAHSEQATLATREVEIDKNNTEEELALMFDAVPVEALEKMFPAGGKWKQWTSKAKENGLINTRKGRAKFNPYLAGLWFTRRGAEGWDDSRLYRTLANNLPEHSRNQKHLLTGDIG